MSVSKKDREAYERGQKEREAQSNPLLYLITPSEHEGDTESEKAAFKKGLRNEQLDQDKGGSGCYLTTACVEYAGLPDDCYELQTMRKFRDGYVRTLPDATTLLEEYYLTAPVIVHHIQMQHNRDVVFQHLLLTLRDVVALIESGQNAEALAVCKEEFFSLRNKYVGGSKKK